MMNSMVFPPEVTGGVPRIIMTGCESVEVEQHRGLLRCETEHISLRTACGVLTIVGRNLALRRYTSGEAAIGGLIDGVTLKGEEGKEA